MATQEVLTALGALHQELEKLHPAIKHVEMAQEVTKSLGSIPSLHMRLAEEIKKEDSAFKKELLDVSSDSIRQLKRETLSLSKEAAELQRQAQVEQENLGQLRGRMEIYYNKIERINFPDRLDKMDNNISAVTLAVQSFQSRIENLERSLVDRLKEGFGQQVKDLAGYQEQSVSRMKKQQVQHYITWAILILIAVGVIYFGLRR